MTRKRPFTSNVIFDPVNEFSEANLFFNYLLSQRGNHSSGNHTDFYLSSVTNDVGMVLKRLAGSCVRPEY